MHALLNDGFVAWFRNNLPRIEKEQAKRISDTHVKVSDMRIKPHIFEKKSFGATDEITPALRLAMDRSSTMRRKYSKDEAKALKFLKGRLSEDDLAEFEDYLENGGWGGNSASARSQSKPNSQTGHPFSGGLEDDFYSADEEEEDHEEPEENDPDIEQGLKDYGDLPEYEEAEDEEEEDKPRLGFRSNSRNPARMSHGNTKPYFGGEEIQGRTHNNASLSPNMRKSLGAKTGEDEPPHFKGRPRPGGSMDRKGRRGGRGKAHDDFQMQRAPAERQGGRHGGRQDDPAEFETAQDTALRVRKEVRKDMRRIRLAVPYGEKVAMDAWGRVNGMSLEQYQEQRRQDVARHTRGMSREQRGAALIALDSKLSEQATTQPDFARFNKMFGTGNSTGRVLSDRAKALAKEGIVPI